MGAFDKLFGKLKVKKQLGNWFQMLEGYSPVFTSYDGGVYEMELTRACIHTFARHCSKLKPAVEGADPYGLAPVLEWKPNIFHTCPQFLYKAATIYKTQNTCFILPVLDQQDRLTGFYPVPPDMTEIREHNGEPFLVYTFPNGEKAAMELSRVGVVSQYLYKSDLVGEDNSALEPTMKLLNVQNQGIEEGIKNGASFRFMAQMSNFSKADDRKNLRKEIVEGLGRDSGGFALFPGPSQITNVQQIQSHAQLVDPEQLKLIQNRVFTYFGCNEKILLNQATGDDWSAYYEGEIEVFALQLATAMTCMTYSANQRSRKNAIAWSANRLQYLTTQEKRAVSTELFDRGILSTNDVMDIWHLPHVKDGDKRYIRKEYTEVTQLDQVTELQNQLAEAQNKINAAQKPAEPAPEGPTKKEENEE